MAKKGSKEPVSTSASALRHNPFAALAAKRDDLPADAPAVSADAPAPAARSAQQTASDAGGSSVAQPGTAKAAARSASSRGRLVLARETKHRGGKPVVIVRGLLQLRDFDEAAIELLAKELKQKLGCGGTVERDGKEPQIVLQGDQPAKVAELLRARGFRVDGVTS